ncbi:MAG: ATP-binding protein [Thermoprotei archaeon]
MATCKVFDPYPKGSRDNFYDREDVLDKVERLAEGRFWPLLLGPKRVGKTSIMKIATKELGGVYIDATGITSIRELGSLLIQNLQTFSVQIDLKLFKIEVQKKPLNTIQTLLSKLDDTLVAIDEIQNISTPWLIPLFSTAYNSSNVRFMFTGSMIGLSKVLIGQSGAGRIAKQFKGRPIVEVDMEPFNEEESADYLRYGAKKCDIKISEQEISDAAATYRGIVGWLTYYGNLRAIGYNHQQAKQTLHKIAQGIIADEYSQLSPLQKTVLKALTLVDQAGWTDLKKLCEALKKATIEDAAFNHALQQLVNAKIARKHQEKYSLIDPMYNLAKNLK